MNFECSRQTCAERTDRHTDKVTPWAPSRSQKNTVSDDFSFKEDDLPVLM